VRSDPVSASTAEFIVGAASLAQLPRGGLPEIALAGRSNVGKSSLLNRLVGRKKLARTSKTPGKTREINLYRIDGKLIIADLPGYGFAKVPKAVKRAWGDLIERYLNEREELRGVVQLVDLRHLPTGDDVQMQEWARHYGVPTLIAATKADKIAKSKRSQAIRKIREVMSPPPETPVISFSAVTGEGAREIWSWVQAVSGVR
jgi:GTP-binding protein